MQIWMVAMLAVSAVLILRDMAKLVFTGRKKGRPVYDVYPQKEKIDRYARSLQKLAHTFYEMPGRQEQLSQAEVQDMFVQVQQRVCMECPGRENCWSDLDPRTSQQVFELLQIIEEGNPDRLLRAQSEWLGQCHQAFRFTEELQRIFFETREELLYRNRLIENRIAVAEQLQEVARTIRNISSDVSAVCILPDEEEERMRKYMHKQRILVKQIWFLDRQDEKKRISLTMRTRGGQCLTMKEVAKHLSHVCGCRMVPSQDSKAVLNSEWRTVLFCEDVNYKVLYGVARVTKERETISGDNYACAATDEQFTMCLSDGMGSGMEASKESETVVELLEQFVTSGFSRETAVRMVNSALILQRKGGMFSSLDVCSLDLYTGICEFLKAGAATTFIRRGNWVETITSTSMAAGLVQKLEFEKTTKKIYDGDYLVMVTDGVLDAFGEEPGEEILKEWILQAQEQMPKELGRYLLEKTLQYADYRAKDDMTVLVAGIWRK